MHAMITCFTQVNRDISTKHLNPSQGHKYVKATGCIPGLFLVPTEGIDS